MDTQLLRTFLEVARTRHFGRAAAALYLTQSAVSARIRQLEDAVGAVLLERNRREVRLTAAGERFAGHAAELLANWAQICREARLAAGSGPTLALGAPAALWDGGLADWLAATLAAQPGFALDAVTAPPGTLLQRVLDGSLDLAFVVEPPAVEGLAVQALAAQVWTLVTTRPPADGALVPAAGIAVESGPPLPPASAPVQRTDSARLALVLLGRCEGTAWLPAALAATPLAAGRLHALADAGACELPVHAIYVRQSPRLAHVLGLLRSATD